MRRGEGGSGQERLASEAFEHLPYGVVVAHRSGAVLATNTAARAMLASPLDATIASTLQEVLPLHHDAEAPTSAPLEVRVNLPADCSAKAAWVTAVALGEDRIVLHLRPGSRHDRRRRVETSWMEASTLDISVFGGLRIVAPHGAIGGGWLDQRPGQLLKYLLCHRVEVVHVEEIASALWPSSGSSSASTVRYYLHTLRSHLEPGRGKRAASSFITTAGGGYQLNLERVTIDADTFEAGVKRGMDALARGDRSRAAREFAPAVALYRGDLLPTERYAEWALRERQRLRRLAHNALSGLCDLKLDEGDLDGAATYAERLADFDPLDADVQRRLIALCVRRGRRSEAARRFERYRLLLRREFDEQPEFTLADVARSFDRVSHAGARPPRDWATSDSSSAR